MKIGYMAIGSQTGQTIHLTEPKYPLKQLKEKLCCKSAKKIYVDYSDGTSKHVGYIIGGEWYTIYEVHGWDGNKE